MAHEHDSLFRSTFQDPVQAGALLRTLLPRDLVEAIDWSTLTLIPGSFVDESLRHKHTDLLFSAMAGGQKVLIYVVLEHKSFGDRFTALQVLHYVVRIHDTFVREHPDATMLPPVIPIVVHHGKHGWKAPRSVLDLIDLGQFPAAVRRILAPLQANLSFVLDDLATTPEAAIRARPMPPQGTLTLLLLQFVRESLESDPMVFAERWLPLWRALWADPACRFGLLSLFSYLAALLEAPPERFRAATARIDEGTEAMGKTIAQQWLEQGMAKGLAKGRAEGKAEGKAEGRAELLLRLIHHRFGVVPPDTERRIRAADIDMLDRWAERILTAASLDELLG